MNTYAIGKPNKAVRLYCTTDDLIHLKLQLAYGEVSVLVTEKVPGKIARDGKSVIPDDIDMRVEQDKIRQHRTNLLARCDYTIFPDSPFTPEQREAWASYRQALRDITADQADTLYDDVVWPEPPQTT